MLRNQIKCAQKTSTILNPPRHADPSKDDFSHPLMAELGTYGAYAVKKAIMGREESHIRWRTASHEGESSFVGMVQLYSDKSKTSLKESAFQFYPLHLALLNFSNEYRRECVVNGRTFVAFLPLTFENDESMSETGKALTRDVRMMLTQEAINCVMAELASVSLEGFLCVDSDGMKRRRHSFLSSYCCDLPEAKDMTSVKNGNSSLRNCHRCMAETKEFNQYTKAKLRCGFETHDTIAKAIELKENGKNEQSHALLAQYSLRQQQHSYSGSLSWAKTPCWIFIKCFLLSHSTTFI